MKNILGIEFEDNATMKDVIIELNKRGINPSTVPYYFLKEKENQKILFDLKQKSVQEIIDICDEEINYIDLRK